MPDFENFTPQDKVLKDDELAKMMAIIYLSQNQERGCCPPDVEREYLRAKALIREYRNSE